MIITKLNERYVFERELGRGAFGVAYLARDKRIHLRRVVIKILFETEGQTFDDASFRMMFEREIKALAGINHPYVVHIYDFGWTPDGEPFIAMQYVEGKTLRAAMEGQAMEPERVALIVNQLGSALSAVHNAGVVHRDLKPENVMLHVSSGDELPILIDFGIARAVSRAPWSEPETWAGTPFYMAPEQLQGHPGTASDVWALGVVAYELVTGRRPFSAADVITLKDGPQPASFIESRASCPELSKAAQSVIIKALSYDLDLRYTYAHEMGKEFLQAVTDGGPLDAPPVPKPATELNPNNLPLVGPNK
jgi:serine/threonine-protein kinase